MNTCVCIYRDVDSYMKLHMCCKFFHKAYMGLHILVVFVTRMSSPLKFALVHAKVDSYSSSHLQMVIYISIDKMTFRLSMNVYNCVSPHAGNEANKIKQTDPTSYKQKLSRHQVFERMRTMYILGLIATTMNLTSNSNLFLSYVSWSRP